MSQELAEVGRFITELAKNRVAANTLERIRRHPDLFKRLVDEMNKLNSEAKQRDRLKNNRTARYGNVSINRLKIDKETNDKLHKLHKRMTVRRLCSQTAEELKSNAGLKDPEIDKVRELLVEHIEHYDINLYLNF